MSKFILLHIGVDSHHCSSCSEPDDYEVHTLLVKAESFDIDQFFRDVKARTLEDPYTRSYDSSTIGLMREMAKEGKGDYEEGEGTTHIPYWVESLIKSIGDVEIVDADKWIKPILLTTEEKELWEKNYKKGKLAAEERRRKSEEEYRKKREEEREKDERKRFEELKAKYGDK